MSTLLTPVIQSLGENFTHFSPALASLLVASVWRGVVLAVVVTLGLLFLPSLSAGTRSVIWLCVLMVVMLSPAMPLLSANHHGAAENATAAGLLHVDPRWSYALAAAWAMFSAFRLTQLAVSAWQLRGLAQRAVPVEVTPNLLKILGRSRRSVQLCTSSEIDRPSVAGFFHARILLPPTLLAQLSESELEQIVLHEMEHLRRRDDWTNLLQKLAVALLPLHPVVVWLDRKLSLERELACDDGVVRATQARKSYAACLTNLAEQSLLRRGVSLALGAIGAVGSWKPQSEVAKRVYRILAKPEATLGRTQGRIAAGALLAGTLCAAIALSHTPHLISFAPEADAPAMAATAPTAEFAGSSVTAPHFIAAKDVMPAAHAVFAKAVVHRVATPHLSNANLQTTSRKVATKQVSQRRSMQAPQQIAPLYRLAAWHSEDMPMPRIALAVQDDSQAPSFSYSQAVYAAVPVRGGWLIVQL